MSRRLAGLLVFSTSAAVLVVEILAGRLLAPYFGVSLDTFTAIIGVVLAGIAAGTWAGGRIADRFDPHRLIAPQLLAGGLSTLLVVPLVRMLGSGLAPYGIPGLVLLTALAAFLPAAALSAVSPTVVKIVLSDLDQTGRIVGRLSALGTAGALLGTFGSGYLLVGNVRTSVTVVAVGGIAAIGGVWWWVSERADDRRLLGVYVPVAIVLAAVALVAEDPCDVETRYTCAAIVEDPLDPDGRFLVLDGIDNSYVDLGDPTALRFTYTRMFGAVLEAATTGPIDAVHVGGGGLTMARWLDTARPGSTSVVLELDPALLDLAVERLGYHPDPDIRLVAGDARSTLSDLQADSADVAIGDAFSGLTVPWHLTTGEFLTGLDRVLRPGGAYLQNVVDRGPLGFLRAQAATVAGVFDQVAIVTLPERFESGGNFVIVGSAVPLDPDRVVEAAARAGLAVTVLDGAALAAFLDGARPLIDDFAPVDQLLG